MFHLTLFGGTEGDISPAGFTALTVFGGAELRRPTIATQLLHLKSARGRRPGAWERLVGSDKNLILTVFGGTVVRAPTLVEEYSALSSAVGSGALTTDECSRLLDELIAGGGEFAHWRTLTLFGACVTRHPSTVKERKALDAAVKTGTVSQAVRATLESVVGSPPQAKVRALGQLATA